MERERSTKYLTEDLVEKIISMLPFSSIFKARMLSKSWLARLSPIESSHDDDGDEGKAKICPMAVRRFQQMVTERSKKWDIFCPVSLGSEEECYAYSPASQAWQKIPSLSFIPGSFWTFSMGLLNMEAALLFLSRSYYAREHKEELYVANVLTRTWKLLPTRPSTKGDNVLLARMVTNPSTQTYKVVLFVRNSFHYRVNHEISVQIYDSKACCWSSKKLVMSRDFWFLASAVYFNGCLYMVGNYKRLVAFHVEAVTLTELNVLDEVDMMGNHGLYFAHQLVVCNGNLLVIVTRRFGGGPDLHLRIMKIDLKLGRLSESVQGPPSDFNLLVKMFYRSPVVHGNCIYLGVENLPLSAERSPINLLRPKPGGQMLTYNVEEKVWSCVPVDLCINGIYTGSSFQPGLSPFMAV